jgi:beta-lactamase class A
LVALSLAFIGAVLMLLLAGNPVREQEEEAAVDASRAVIEQEEPQEEAPPAFDAEALEEKLEEIAGGYEGVYGVSVLEPDSGTKVSLRGDEEFMSASIGKLPVFAALYAAAARGELDLDEEISMRSEDVQSYGSGSLHSFPVGYSLSLRECAYLLVNHSDNTAWAMLDRRLGEEEISAEIEGMGLQDSTYSGYLSGYYTTPDDVLLLLEKISNPSFTNEELSVEMLEAMTNTTFEDRIPEKLPEDVRVAHKIGSYDGNFGDAGVVFYRDSRGEARRYYLSVLSKETGEYAARDVMQEVSLAVYEAVSGNTVDPDWSRGSADQEKSDPVEQAVAPPAEVPTTYVEPAEPLPTISPPSAERQPPESRYNAAPNPPAVLGAAPGATPKTAHTPPPYPTPAARAPTRPAHRTP